MSDIPVKIEFGNLHFDLDGVVRNKWDVLLRTVGDVTVWVGDKAIYREVEFCVVEFAVALANWLSLATDLGPEFSYTSLESETPGLLRFTRLRPGFWQVSAAYQDQEVVDSVTTADLERAALTYIRSLRVELMPHLDVLRYIEDPKVRVALRA